MFKMQIGSGYMKVAAFILLCICSVSDIRRKEIPLAALLAGFMAALGINGFNLWKGWASVTEIAISLLPGIFFIIISFCTGEKVGYGDGLFIIILGMLLGFGRCIFVICVSLVFSSAFALILLVLHRAGRNSRLPLVPFFAIGMGVNFFV